MKSYKKYMKLTATIGTFLLLVACGPQPGEDTSRNIGRSDSEYDLLVWEDIEKSAGIEEAIRSFELEHDVKIKVVEQAFAGQIEDLRLDGPAGIGPDVITMPSDQIGTAVLEGLIRELNVDEDTQATFTEVAMQSQIVDGKVYGLPKAVETAILFYNKDIIASEDVPETLDEWYELSKDIRETGEYGFLALWDQIYYAYGVIDPYGGYIFQQDANGNYDVKDIGLNNEGAIEAAELMAKFYDEDIFPSGMIGTQGINVLDALFTEGRAAAVVSGPWSIEPYTRSGIDIGIKPLPILPNGEHMTALMGVKSYNVSSFSTNPELAEQLVIHLTNEENSRDRYMETLEVPAVKALVNDPVVTENEGVRAIAEQSQHSTLVPNIPEMAEVWTPADAALQIIANGASDPRSALNEAVDFITSQIEAIHGNL